MKNIRKSDVKKAIEGSGGYMTNVAKKLNCDWHTAKRYVDKYQLQNDLIEEDEKLNDLTEMKLIENIKNGDTTSIIFRLKTRAKNRGYIESRDYSVQINEEKNRVASLFPTLEELNYDESDQ